MSQTQRATQEASRSATILLLADDVALRHVLVEVLVEAGYEVLHAPTVHPDLAIVEERQLPSRSAAAADWPPELSPDVPVLLLSGLGRRRSRDGVWNNVSAELRKPFSSSSLLQAVQQAMTQPRNPA